MLRADFAETLPPSFKWKRFWAPLGTEVPSDARGYIVDPESSFWNRVTTDVVPLEALADTPCVVFLGGPGIGKTRQIKDEVARLHAAGVAVRYVNLGVHDRATLRSDVLDADWLRRWRDGTEHLTLFFDALDESLSNIQSFADYFLHRLAELPLDRLRLRIACRAPVWPAWFDRDLEQLIGEGRLERYELLPLRARDVEDAARQVGLDVPRFFEALDRANAHGLAARPLTLQMLLHAARALGGDLPSSRADLFARAVEKLADEPAVDRDPRTAWDFDRARRVAAAARIAAASVLCRKHVISRNEDWPHDELALYPRDIAGGQEPCERSKADVPQALIEETLRTALFTAVDLKRVTWSHRSVAEYLAARWLKANDITGDRATPLLFHPIETSKVIPQLRGVASWLASFDRQTLVRLIDTDPLVLVTGDTDIFDDAARARIVSAFLDKLDKLEAHDWMGDVHRYYANLAHTGLAEQLRPYIVDETKNVIVRRAAIDIGGACRVTALEDILVDLALRAAENQQIRARAIWALTKLASSSARLRLRELLEEHREKRDDEVFGAVLHALWPRHLTAEELFTVLRPRRRPHIDLYWSFLSSAADVLRDQDVPLALQWALDNLRAFSRDPIIPKIAIRAQRLHADPKIRQQYTRLMVRAIEGHHARVLDGLFQGEMSDRVALFPLVLDQTDNVFDFFHLIRSRSKADLAWLPSLLNAPLTPAGRNRLIELLANLLRVRNDAEFTEAVEKAACSHEDLASACGAALKRDAGLADSTTQRQRVLLNPPPRVRVRNKLDHLENGDLDAFWQLTLDLTLWPDSRGYEDVSYTQIINQPGWKEADEATRSRIVEGARRYLEGCDPRPDEWLEERAYYHPANAGYRALQLLADVAPERLDSLRVEVWQCWAPAVVGVASVLSLHGETFQDLLRRFYVQAPDETLDALLRVISSEDRNNGRITSLHAIESIWDARVMQTLSAWAYGNRLRPETISQVMTLLLRHDVPGALTHCERMLRTACREGGTELRSLVLQRQDGTPLRARLRSRAARRYLVVPDPRWRTRKSRNLAVLLCQALVEGGPHRGWPLVWELVCRASGFGREVMVRIAKRAGTDSYSWLKVLTEEQVGELYSWMRRTFPPGEDPFGSDMHDVTGRQVAGELRDRLIAHLSVRKTLAARDALRRLAEETGNKSLLLHAVDAEQQALDETWVAPTVADILKFSEQRDSRIVLSEAHLLDVVIAALHDVNKKLQGEIPLVRFLWDETSARPKDEEALSDFIASHLQDSLVTRGVIANREVQIRPRRGDRAGEEADIHVDAFTPRTKERVSVIIEVKGNWNRELERAIDAQLGDRYLADNQCRHGVYVVGWFESPKWDPADGRQPEASRRDREATRMLLEERAAERAKHGQTIKVVILNARM